MKKSLVLLLSIFMSISLISFNIVKTSAEDEVNEPEVVEENIETIEEELEEVEEEVVVTELEQLLSQEYISNQIENDVVEIQDFKTLKTFLSSNDTKKGKLTNNSYVLNELLVVNGNKTLDLNGKTIKADDSYSGNMFQIAGSLTINDSTVSKDTPYGLGIIDGNYIKGSVTHNDLIRGFNVGESKSLTINGGTIKNMYVADNTNYGGAAIVSAGTLIINGGLINNCHVGGTNAYGGAIISYCSSSDSNLTINGGTISNCSALVSGGAIYNYGISGVAGTHAYLTINDGSIISCNAKNGGAIFNGINSGSEAITTINNGIISNCKANNVDGYGGAILNGFGTELLINNGTIDSCSAANGGAIANNTGTILIKKGNIKECSATIGGAAIYNDGYGNNTYTAKVTIEGGTIDSCDGVHYGALGNFSHQGKAEIVIKDGIIKNCKATYSYDSYGGAIYNYGYNSYIAQVTIEGGTIQSCSAYCGGAVSNIANSGPTILTLNKGLIKDCDSTYGGAICNSGTAVINDGSIYKCSSSYYGGAIYSYCDASNSKLTINGGTILECIAVNYGGAIYITATSSSAKKADLEINGGVIDSCSASTNGGAIGIYIPNGNVSEMNIKNNTIKNCTSFDGGALHAASYYGTLNILLENVKILNCKSDYSAIDLVHAVVLKLKGNITLDNKNDSGKKDDICIDSDTKVVLCDNFVPTNKIGIWVVLSNLGHNKELNDVVTCNGFTLGQGKTLKDIFLTANGQEYSNETGTSSTDHSLSFKSVQITTHPTLDSIYKLQTDKDGTPITTSYQWYRSDILDKIQVKGLGNYGKIGEGKLNFTISKDSYCSGNPDDTTGIWTMAQGHQYYNRFLFKISSLKKGDVLSFDYTPAQSSGYMRISICDDDSEFSIYESYDPTSGTYKVTIPHDGYYWICFYCMNNNYSGYLQCTASNIIVKHLDVEQKINGQTSDKLAHPYANADILCKVAYTNDDGYTNYENSNTLNFGEVSEGYDKQVIKPGTSKDLIIKFETNPKLVTYYKQSDINKVIVYVDGLDNKLTRGQEYDIDLSEIQSNANPVITLTLNKDYVSTLSEGDHAYFVKVSDTKGYECIATNVIVKNDSPTPSPSKKAELCEDVIGPTWHWNNDKGVCEEVGIVGTFTR